MPRKARVKFGNSIYHICSRGNNKQNIFKDDEDKNAYLNRVKRYAQKYKMVVIAYCLMDNHVHLLNYDNNEDISQFMHGLNLSYVSYFHEKYNMCGHLFQQRFTSSIVDNDSYLLNASRYIHLNPVKARMVNNAQDYKWSSYNAYILGKDDLGLVNCSECLGIIGNDLVQSRNYYREYVENVEIDKLENPFKEREKEDKKNKEAEIETAATKENMSFKKHLAGIPVVSKEAIENRLREIWGKELKEIIVVGKDKLKALTGLYLMALLGRFSYVELSRIYNISVNIIYKMIWKLIGLMMTNSKLDHQIDELINYF